MCIGVQMPDTTRRASAVVATTVMVSSRVSQRTRLSRSVQDFAPYYACRSAISRGSRADWSVTSTRSWEFIASMVTSSARSRATAWGYPIPHRRTSPPVSKP